MRISSTAPVHFQPRIGDSHWSAEAEEAFEEMKKKTQRKFLNYHEGKARQKEAQNRMVMPSHTMVREPKE